MSLQDADDDGLSWDVFVSHKSEDTQIAVAVA